jgi:hypothetical protein
MGARPTGSLTSANAFGSSTDVQGTAALPGSGWLRPVTPSSSGTSDFYNTTDLNIAGFSKICSGFCENAGQSPSVLPLSNGNIGVAFSVTTNATISSCPGAAKNTSIQLAYAVSTDSGATFGTPHLIGDPGTSTCPYIQELEPSFAVSGTGAVFGAYVEANASASTFYPGYDPIYSYTDRFQDAIAFTSSTNNGTSFTSGKIVGLGPNVSRPALATFGNSVYIVYQNNSTSPAGASMIPGGDWPISLDFLYSSDAGATWTGPTVLPVEPGGDPAERNTTLSPSIAVNATGTVAVAYADNRSCIAYCGIFYGASYGYDIVATTSATNGTTWTGPARIATDAGQAPGNVAAALFEESPTTTVGFGPTPGTLYVAWSASYNLSINDPQYALFVGPDYDFTRPTVYTAASSNNGASWSAPEMVPPPLRSEDGFSGQIFGEANFNVALAVSPTGTVYLAWSYYSWTNGACGYTAFSANSFAQSNEEYMATSLDGINWSTPSLVNVTGQSAGIDYLNYLGYTASIGFTSGGQPIVGYSMDTVFIGFSTTGVIYSQSQLEIGVPYEGPTTQVTVDENGLPAGTAWTGLVEGVGENTTASSFTIPNVPVDRPMYVQWPGGFPKQGSTSPFIAPVVSDAPLVQQAPSATFSSPTTIYYNFTTFYPLKLTSDPSDVPAMDAFWQDQGPSGAFQYNGYWSTYVYPPTVYAPSYSGCQQPWFFPSGLTLPIGGSSGSTSLGMQQGTVDYWSGTGTGSYTGSGPVANVTIDGPVNETFWLGGVGNYSEQFHATGLPSSSTFRLDVDGTPYSSPASTGVQVPGLSTGPHRLANITASSSLPGWEYFGSADTGTPFVLPEQPIVNLSFALVDAAASAGTISFHAPQISAGTSWSLEVNGTTYSSTQPWINITARPGTYPVEAFPSVQSTGSATLVPVSPSSVLSLAPGGVYDINYTAEYRVTESGTAGGHITGPAEAFYAPNASVALNASPAVGYTWGGWSGQGPGSYSGPNQTQTLRVGGPIQEVAQFDPLPLDRFNLTVSQSGVPIGDEWSVNLNGVGYSSNSSSLVIPNLFAYTGSGSQGRYTLQVPYAYDNSTVAGTRFVPSSYSSTVLGGGTANVQYTPQYYLDAATSTGGSVSTPSGWVAANSPTPLSATADPGYGFAGWVGSGIGNYTGPLADASVSPGGPVSETAMFSPLAATPPSRFTVSFKVTPAFAEVTSWALTFNGTIYSTTGIELNVSGVLAGTYPLTVGSPLAPSGLIKYTPVTPSFSLQVTGNVTHSLSYAVSDWVSIRSAGPGLTSPSSGWFAGGRTLVLNASATGNNLFAGWAGTGTGSYSGTQAQVSLTVSAPLTEVATFVPPAPSATTTTPGTSSIWDSPLSWAELAVVGLIIGLIVGLLVGRRGPGTPPPAEAESPPPEEGSQEPVVTDEPLYGDSPPEASP